MAQEKAPGSPALVPQSFQIISLHIIDQTEARSGVQLLAVTMNGVRLYFATSAISYGYSYGGMGGSYGGNRSLQLIHVRLPPANLPHPDEMLTKFPPATVFSTNHVAPQPVSRPSIISTLENCCYSEGLTVAAQQGDTDGTDFILCMSPDLTRIGSLGQLQAIQPPPPVQPSGYMNPRYMGTPLPSRLPLTEYATVLAIPGRTWAMAPVPSQKLTSASPSLVVINELATQFTEMPKEFMILTNVGVTFLAKRRAVDYLKAVIEEVQSDGNVQPIIEFRDRLAFILLLVLPNSSSPVQFWTGPNLCHVAWSREWEHFFGYWRWRWVGLYYCGYPRDSCGSQTGVLRFWRAANLG